MTYELKYKPFGECSVLIEWPAVIDESILLDILKFKENIAKKNIKGIVEVRSSYCSLLIIYDFHFWSFRTLSAALKKRYKQHRDNVKISITQWKIPVCYDDAFAIDLDMISREKSVSKESIVRLHSETIYTVYFIGFLPGFMYLGGLHKDLYVPRKETPRLTVKKGAVAIGGKQTGVYPNESPGGWNIIGNSPIDFFNVESKTPCFAKAGDKISFKPISYKEYTNIKALVEAGVYQLESEVIRG